jgi:hypothetical protein
MKAASRCRNKHWILPRNTHSKFTGRQADLAKLESQVLDPDPKRDQRMVVITGIGGVGKSELALKFAIQHRDR